jgi:type I restriction enzyme S subunit
MRADCLYPYYGATGQVGLVDDFLFDEPLILLGEDGVPFFDLIRHKAYLIDGKCWVNNHAHVLRAISAVTNRRYLVEFLNLFDYTDFVTGSTRLKLTQAAMRSIPVRLAPRSEQERIANKLDAVLARVNVCRERLDRVPAILKRFRQSVLAAATSGKLTEEWREEVHAGIWGTVSIEQIAEQVFDGPFGSHLKSKDYSETGVRVVRLENIGWLKFIEDKRTFVPHQKYDSLQRHTLRADDILLSSFLSEEVRVCLLPVGLSENAINKADCFCIRLDRKRCSPQFVAMRLASKSTFIALNEQVHGATRPRINLGQLKAFNLDLPPLTEQAEIVHRVKALFACADRLEARYAAARAQVDRLTPALLAKAFRGELVPQDPDDEPASVLLERLRAARAAAPPKPRSRRDAGRQKEAQTAVVPAP